ncbi:MDR family MFS transporter [Pelagibacterium luteolum]|uniref:Drug resistance transporter, EmrB/QacA subfamily n=1 Tax=Pelagibacterium luteolum TaxID=440168 RepID=A0A1G7VUM2_9HYPH|nr:MDR family MFS transporter [Pelagibacterium luteolum]SDG63525.1 drug resistance transporter, EmrB/QacA subfamily [Pelagibacterium luteolum]
MSHSAPAQNPANVKLVIGAVIATLLAASLGQTIITTALPIIVGDLGGIEFISWAITAYLLAATVAAPVFGKLGDMYGRKLMLQIGIGLFLLGSVIAAFSVDLTMLVVCRFIQGLGGGGLIVTAMAAVGDVLPARERGKAQGFIGAAFGLSTVIGPLIGGVIVEALSWRWLFLVNVPVGIAAFAVIAIAFETREKGKQHKIDYVGAILLAAALSALVIYTSIGGTILPWAAPEALILPVIAAAALVGFIIVERRAVEPILPLYLFRNNAFLVSNGIGFIVGTVMFGTITYMPSYLLIVQGFSPTQAGLALLPMMVGLIGSSTLSGLFMSRTGRYKMLPIISSAMLAIGATLLSTLGTQTPFALVVLYTFIVGVGIGPIMSVGVAAIQNAVPHTVMGVATASAQMFRQIGGSLGVAVLGAIFANRLAFETAAIGHDEGTAGFNADILAAMPATEQAAMLEAYVSALHPIYWVAAAAAVIAFAIGWLLVEIPLSDRLPATEDTDAEPQAAE